MVKSIDDFVSDEHNSAGFYRLTKFAKNLGIATALAFSLITCGSKSPTEPTPPPQTCTSFTYGDWGVCQPSNTRTRSATGSPSGCTGGNPDTTQSCTYISPGTKFTLTINKYVATTGNYGSISKEVNAQENVNVCLNELNLPNVDSERIALREATPIGSRVGPYISSVTSGGCASINLSSNRSVDAFAFTLRNGANYGLVDAGKLQFSRDVTVSRGPDDGTTGPDEFINNTVSEDSKTLNPAWKSFGNMTRVSGSSDITVIYSAALNACASGPSQFPRKFIFLNPAACATHNGMGIDMRGVLLEDLFEFQVGLENIFGSTSTQVVDWSNYRRSAMGADLLTYVYLKDSK